MRRRAAVSEPISGSEAQVEIEMRDTEEHEQQAAADIHTINGWITQMKLKGDRSNPTDLFGLATRVLPSRLGSNFRPVEMKATVKLEYSTGTAAVISLEANDQGWKTVKVTFSYYSQKNKVRAELTLEDWVLRGLLACTPQSMGTTKELIEPEIKKAVILPLRPAA